MILFVLILDLVQLVLAYLGMIMLFILILTARQGKHTSFAAVIAIMVIIIFSLLFVPRMVISWKTIRMPYTVNRNLRLRRLRLVTTILLVILQIIGFIANNFSIINIFWLLLEVAALCLIILHSKRGIEQRLEKEAAYRLQEMIEFRRDELKK